MRRFPVSRLRLSIPKCKTQVIHCTPVQEPWQIAAVESSRGSSTEVMSDSEAKVFDARMRFVWHQSRLAEVAVARAQIRAARREGRDCSELLAFVSYFVSQQIQQARARAEDATVARETEMQKVACAGAGGASMLAALQPAPRDVRRDARRAISYWEENYGAGAVKKAESLCVLPAPCTFSFCDDDIKRSRIWVNVSEREKVQFWARMNRSRLMMHQCFEYH